MKDFNLNIGGVIGGLLGLAAIVTVITLFPSIVPSNGLITGLVVAGGAIIGNYFWSCIVGKPGR